MPPKDYNQTQIFFKTENGEYHPVSASIEECAEMVSDVDSTWNNPEYFKGGEMTFEIPRKEYERLKKILQSVCPIYSTNNWRKMHHLPLIGRRGR